MSDVYCWRCTRKLFRVRIPAGVSVPAGVIIEQPCSRCRAMNAIPLDSLPRRTLALA